MTTFTGSCHCGAVRFEVDAEKLEATDCNCSMCTKKGIIHLIVSKDRFRLVSGEENLTTYRFNTGVARHTFCKTCGIHPFYTPRSHPEGVDVNIRCLDEVDISAFERRPFDGRNWEQARSTLPDL